MDSSGTKTFKRAGVGVTAPVLSDGTANFTPSGEKRGSVKTTFHSALKNDDVQTSSSQAVSASKQFDAFGNELSGSGSWKSQFGYAGGFGYQSDPDSGLKLLGHRYYDSDTGRFLTRDPAKDGRNWYGYCGNNPVTRLDPTGLIMTAAGFSAAARTFANPNSQLHDDYMNELNNPNWGSDDSWNRNQDCAGFVCYLIRAFIDPSCPASGTTALLNYLINSELWEEVPWDPSNMKLQPGDIIISAPMTRTEDAQGHVGIYVGNNTVAQASLGKPQGPHTIPFWGRGGFFNYMNSRPNKPRVFRLKKRKSSGIRVDISGQSWKGNLTI